MAPSTRHTHREQPLLRHFRAAKPSAPVVKGEASRGKPSRVGVDGQQLSKGKGKAIVDDNDQSIPAAPARPSTPPPRHASATSTTTPHSPPRTPVPRTRTATLPEYDLLEPEHRSPISVRTDPDSGKMFLMLSHSSTSSAHVHRQQGTREDHDATPRHKRIKREGVIQSDEDDELTIIETPKAIRERIASEVLSSAAQTPGKATKFALACGTPTQTNLQERAKQRKRQRRSKSPETDEQNNPFLATELQSSGPRPASLFIQPIDGSNANSIVRGSRTLPLPKHHATLYALHAALEHALVVYLATVGTGGSMIEEVVESVSNDGDGDNAPSTRSVLAIPELITMSALRPLVERSCGRRFGKQELARLLWIWSTDNGDARRSRRSDVGLTVTRTRTLDKSGKRIHDHALGIRLYTDAGDSDDSDEDERPAVGDDATPSKGSVVHTPPRASAQRRALTMGGEPMSPSPSPRITRTPGRTPPGSPSAQRTLRAAFTQHPHASSPLTSSSPSSSSSLLYSRRGISLVALWNNGLERRKRVVRRRLLRWCLDCFAAWKQERRSAHEASPISLSQQTEHDQAPAATGYAGLGIVHDDCPLDADIDDSARTPRQSHFSHSVELGQGGLPTPSATREEGHIPGAKRVYDHFADTAASMSQSSSMSSSYVLEWDADFPLERVAPIPMASLPSLDEPVTSSRVAASSSDASSSGSLPAQLSRLEAARQAHRDAVAQSEETLGRKLTLAERIRAKEEAAAAKKRGNGGSEKGDEDAAIQSAALTSAQAVAAAARKRSSLSRLQGVAESIYMLFITSSSGGGGGGGGGAPLRFVPLPLHDVLKAICGASRTAMSATDAQACLDQLQTIAPGFVEVDSVGARRWIRLIGRVEEGGSDNNDEDGGGAEVVGAAMTTSMSSSSMLAAVRRCVRAELQRLEASEA